MSNAQAIETDNRYIDFWNAVLVPKFNDWRHILAGGLHLHSAKVFPALSELATACWTRAAAAATPRSNSRNSSGRQAASLASTAAAPFSTPAARTRRPRDWTT
jgi:hypothetical protein